MVFKGQKAAREGPTPRPPCGGTRTPPDTHIGHPRPSGGTEAGIGGRGSAKELLGKIAGPGPSGVWNLPMGIVTETGEGFPPVGN